MIDGALSRFLIQEHTSLAKQTIRPAPENPFLTPKLGKPLTGYFRSNIKVRSQSLNISGRNLHAIIDRATVCDAFIAVVLEGLAGNARC
jgi:hypothetical protein